MKTLLGKMGVFLLAGLLGCDEAGQPLGPDNQVEIKGLQANLEVPHGTEVHLYFSVMALDGLSSIKISQDGKEMEDKNFAGEMEFEGDFSFKAQIMDVGFWEPAIKDSVEVVIFARDLDGDTNYKRTVIKVLAP